MPIQDSQLTVYFDPPARSFLNDRMFDDGDNRPIGDHLMAPWSHLRDHLAARGVTVRTVDAMPEKAVGERCLFIAVSSLEHYRRVAGRPDVTLSAFISMECPVVEPGMYRALRDVSRRFKRVFSWSDAESLEPFIGERIPLHLFRWPQSFNRVHESIWNRRDRRFLVMINANKLPRLYHHELYTKRLAALEFFARTGEIDLYGAGWDGPPLRLGKTGIPYTFLRVRRKLDELRDRVAPDKQLQLIRTAYRGRAASKAEVLGQYNFAICFENMVLKGWITEKIFDCFFAGTVPVYWGAPEIGTLVPPECFIDMRKFQGFAELREHLKSLSEADIQRYRENARDFLNSPAYRPFTKEVFAQHFVRFIEEDTGVQL